MFSLVSILVINTVYLQVVALNSSESFVSVNHDTNNDYSLCNNVRVPCVRKCCPERHVLENKTCVHSDELDFNIKVFRGMEDVSDVSNVTFNVIHDDKCYQHRLALIPAFDETLQFFIQTNGSLFWPAEDPTQTVPFNHFCLETIVFGESERYFSALVCYNETNLLSEKDGKYGSGTFIAFSSTFHNICVCI